MGVAYANDGQTRILARSWRSGGQSLLSDKMRSKKSSKNRSQKEWYSQAVEAVL